MGCDVHIKRSDVDPVHRDDVAVEKVGPVQFGEVGFAGQDDPLPCPAAVFRIVRGLAVGRDPDDVVGGARRNGTPDRWFGPIGECGEGRLRLSAIGRVAGLLDSRNPIYILTIVCIFIDFHCIIQFSKIAAFF